MDKLPLSFRGIIWICAILVTVVCWAIIINFVGHVSAVVTDQFSNPLRGMPY